MLISLLRNIAGGLLSCLLSILFDGELDCREGVNSSSNEVMTDSLQSLSQSAALWRFAAEDGMTFGGLDL